MAQRWGVPPRFDTPEPSGGFQSSGGCYPFLHVHSFLEKYFEDNLNILKLLEGVMVLSLPSGLAVSARPRQPRSLLRPWQNRVRQKRRADEMNPGRLGTY